MSSQVTLRVTDTLLPSALIKFIENDEKGMMATALLVVNLLSDLVDHVTKKIPQGLDGFPGDRNCQGRLVVLPQLLEKPEIGQEIGTLAEIIPAKMESLKERRRTKDSPPSVFFEKEIVSLHLSKDVLYLLDCRILKLTRTTQYVEPCGIVHSMIDHGLLDKLSPKFQDIDSKFRTKFRAQITQNASTRLSAETMIRLQDNSRRMKAPDLLQRMLQEVVVIQPENYPPKSFGCQFSTVQLALLSLLENRTPLAIKTIVPLASPEASCLIFFQAHDQDFAFQDLTGARQLALESYVAIFQAVVPSVEALLDKIKQIGFMELILRFSAQEAPFHATSSLTDVKDGEARRLLEEYRAKAAESGCNHTLIKIHHIYLSTIQSELK